MRIRHFLIISLLALPVCDAPAGSVKADEAGLLGAWSEVADGVRARLAYVESDRAEAQLRQGIVYVDLQNTSRLEPKYLYYAPARSPVRCSLRKATGEAVPQAGSAYSGPIPSAAWLTIPGDGILRVRVTMPGFGIPAEAGLFVAGQIPDTWLLPAASSEEYLLSASITIADPKASAEGSDPAEPFGPPLAGGSKSWQGKLELPAVRIGKRPAPAALPYEIVIESEPVVLSELSQHAFPLLIRDLGVQRMIASDLYWV